MRVAIVEDQQTDFSFIRRKLKSLNIEQVVHFRSGESLINEIRRGYEADLFFLDVQVRSGGVDGRELVDQLKSNSRLKRKTVALMSSNPKLIRDTKADYAFDKGGYRDLVESVEKVVLACRDS